MSKPKIEKVFVYLTVTDKGEEGIAGYPTEKHGIVPMITADKERAERLRPAAQEIAIQTGRPVRLVQFKSRRQVESFLPAKADA